jgi:hypothetical protein
MLAASETPADQVTPDEFKLAGEVARLSQQLEIITDLLREQLLALQSTGAGRTND